MSRILRVVALMLSLALGSSVLAWGAQLPVAQPPALDAAEAQPLALIPAPAVEMANKNLTDEIFKVGLPEANELVVGYWGRCSQSCASCWSLTGCPPDDDGTPQGCFRFCP